MPETLPNYTVLDIGTGSGGKYLLKDKENKFRVAMDINRQALAKAKRQYEVSSIVANADVNPEISLPFREASIDTIEMRFPHGTLMLALASSNNLWSEFRRVLKEQGNVYVLFDVPPNQKREIECSVGSTTLARPQDLLSTKAKANSFAVFLDTIHRTKLQQIDTAFSRKMNFKLMGNPRYSVYELIAIKN